jgi:hypothetical protein
LSVPGKPPKTRIPGLRWFTTAVYPLTDFKEWFVGMSKSFFIEKEIASGVRWFKTLTRRISHKK